MTCLARRFAKIGGSFATRLRAVSSKGPERNSSDYPRHRTLRGSLMGVTKPRDGSRYSPYLPAAGLYSLFSDSFGPVP